MGKTYDVAKDRDGKPNDSVLPCEIDFEIEHAPSARALTLFLTLNAAAGPAMAEPGQKEIILAEIEGSNHRRETEQHLKELTACLIASWDARKKEKTFGHLLDECRIVYSEDHRRLVVRYHVGRTYRRFMKNSDLWSLLDLEAVRKMRSKYALYLYLELAKHWFKDSQTEIYLTTDRLRHVLKVPDGKLSNVKDLRKFALDPAIKAVDVHSRYNVSYEEQREGRGRGGKLQGVTIKWQAKPWVQPARRNTEAPHKPQKPLSRPPFPASGGIRDNAFWYALARKHCKSPLPDMTILADKFRARLRAGKIDLDSHRVENVFIRFCEAWTPR